MDILSQLSNLEDKLYFTMSEVSDFCSLEPHVLRYWEREFKQLKPKKINNHRRYQKKDIEIILIIQYFIHSQNLTIKKAQKKLDKKIKQELIKSANADIYNDIKKDLENILKILN